MTPLFSDQGPEFTNRRLAVKNVIILIINISCLFQTFMTAKFRLLKFLKKKQSLLINVGFLHKGKLIKLLLKANIFLDFSGNLVERAIRTIRQISVAALENSSKHDYKSILDESIRIYNSR